MDEIRLFRSPPQIASCSPLSATCGRLQNNFLASDFLNLLPNYFMLLMPQVIQPGDNKIWKVLAILQFREIVIGEEGLTDFIIKVITGC